MHQSNTIGGQLRTSHYHDNLKRHKSFIILITCILCLQRNILLLCDAFSFSSSRSSFMNQFQPVKESDQSSTPIILRKTDDKMVNEEDASDGLGNQNKRRLQRLLRLRNPRRRGRRRLLLQEEGKISPGKNSSFICEEEDKNEDVKVVQTKNNVGLGKRIRLLGQNRPKIQNLRIRLNNDNIQRKNWRPIIRIVRFRRSNNIDTESTVTNKDENTTEKMAILEERVQDSSLSTKEDQKSTMIQPTGDDEDDQTENSSIDIPRTIDIRGETIQDDQLKNQQQNQIDQRQNIAKKKGGRVKLSSKYQTSRVIVSADDTKADGLLNEYMKQPITSFSLRSFHDNESPKAEKRRWMIRLLNENEIIHQPNFFTKNRKKPFKDNVFRLAVPLMPLLGVDLTPIIDLEVITANNSNGSEKLFDNEKQFFFKSGEKSSSNVVKIRSLRMSLLATDDEMKKYKLENGSLKKMKDPIPTKVSKDQSVRQIGNEAIHIAEKLEKWLEPHLSFEAIISWNDNKDNLNNSNSQQTVSVDSKAIISLTIPSIPFAIPIPSSFLIEQIGSNVLRRLVKLGLNQFLRQVEIDFKRWAEIDK